MRCQSGLIAPALLLIVVITSAGAYPAAPTTAPTPAPTPSIASPSTAPDAAPSAVPQTTASASRPERLRLRRSGSTMPREYRRILGAGCRSRRIGAMEERDLAVSLARGRIAFGVVSLLAPGLVARTMTGGGPSEGATRLFVRMVGARDLGVGLGLQVAFDRDAATRGWLEASAVVDGIDAAACLLARHHLRPGVFPGTLSLAAAGALLSAWLARQLD